MLKSQRCFLPSTPTHEPGRPKTQFVARGLVLKPRNHEKERPEPFPKRNRSDFTLSLVLWSGRYGRGRVAAAGQRDENEPVCSCISSIRWCSSWSARIANEKQL